MKRSPTYTMADPPSENRKYGGLWFVTMNDGTKKRICCGKDLNIMFKLKWNREDFAVHGGVKEFWTFY